MPTAELVDGRIVVMTTWTEKEAIKSVPGSRWNSKDKHWWLPLSWASCLQLRGVFGNSLTVGPSLAEWSWNDFTHRVQPAIELRTQVERELIADDKRYPFQAVGVDFMLTAGSCLLGDDTGTGKTVQALSALSQLDGLPALVVCPNSVKTNWATQAEIWYPEATPYVLRGGTVQKKKTLDAARDDPSALIIVNIEAMRMLSRLAPFGNTVLRRCRECDRHGEEGITPTKCDVHPKPLNSFKLKTVIIDEAHKIKEPSARSTRACWAVGHMPSVQQRWALTGTPIANHVGDLWAIMHFVEPNEWPTKSKAVDRYALTAWNPYGGLDIVGINPTTREEFYQILDPRFRRTPKQLVLTQLPSVVRSTLWVDMTPKQAKAYRELEKQLVTRMDDGQILITPDNMQKALRLTQLAASYANIEWIKVEHETKCLGTNGRNCRFCPDHVECRYCETNHMKMIVTLAEPSPKIDALMEYMDGLGGKPVVIAAESRQLIDLTAKRFEKLKMPYGLITGPVPEYERQQTIKRFQRGELQAILFTAKAGGTGVDGLQHSDTMIVLQRPTSMIDNVQMEGRVNRIGSEKHHSIHIVDIVAHDTIEATALFPRLLLKFEQLELINRDRARLVAAGVDSPEMFTLQQRETQILTSSLGLPPSPPNPEVK